MVEAAMQIAEQAALDLDWQDGIPPMMCVTGSLFVVAEAREVSDEMFLVAAETLAHQVSEDRLEVGALYPNQSELRAVSREVAIAVARCARDGGIGRHFQDEEIAHAVDAMVWQPGYVPYEPIPWD